MQVERGVHELDEMVEGEELEAHAGLVAEEVALLQVLLVRVQDVVDSSGLAYHPFHKANEAPEGYGVILHHRVDGRKQVAHALHVA